MDMNSRISFKSNINFVGIDSFSKIRNGNYIDFKKNFINALFSPEFYTESIMDCTAGGFSNTARAKSVGFHITGQYSLNCPPFNIIGKAKNGLIIGSKNTKLSINSVHNFEIIKKYLSEKVENLSVFCQYRYKSSMSDIHYSLKNDTWTINSIYYNWALGLLHVVDTPKKLLKAFKEIKIAKGDRLFFEGKEVLPAQVPSIFEKQT